MLKIFVIELEFIYTQGCPSFLLITLYNIMVFLNISKENMSYKYKSFKKFIKKL